MKALTSRNYMSYETLVIKFPVIVWNPQAIMTNKQYKNNQVGSSWVFHNCVLKLPNENRFNHLLFLFFGLNDR